MICMLVILNSVYNTNPIKYDVTNVTSYVRSKFSGSRFIIWHCKNMYARGLASLG